MTENEVRVLMSKVEKLLISQAEMRGEIRALKDQVDGLRSNHLWMIRIVGSILVGAFMSLLISSGGRFL